MKAAKAWCITGLMLVAGFSSVSCGKEEGAGGGGGGTGTVITGGSGGKTGRGGDGGGGGTTAMGATTLGRGCVSDAECADTKAPGLKCVTSTSTELDGGAPPKGLCTAPCMMPGQDQTDECVKYGAGAMCYPFGASDSTGYCVEGCSFGKPQLGQTKCHSRPEFGCYPALVGKTDQMCAKTSDCQPGELCLSGVCDVVFPGCLPACRGDIDCDKGLYCDQSFLGGLCVPKKQTGKGLGEPCTVPGPNDPNEPDECLGFCADDDGDAKTPEGHCWATCGLGSPCGWDPVTEKFGGLCAYGYSNLTSDGVGDQGDVGFCSLACNCSTECESFASGSTCQQLTQGALTSDFRGPGLCFSPDPMSKEFTDCQGTGGAGGAGGEASGGTPSGGEASGGAGASSGGAGGAP